MIDNLFFVHKKPQNRKTIMKTRLGFAVTSRHQRKLSEHFSRPAAGGTQGAPNPLSLLVGFLVVSKVFGKTTTVVNSLFFYQVFWFIFVYGICWALNSVGEEICPIRTEHLLDLTKANSLVRFRWGCVHR